MGLETTAGASGSVPEIAPAISAELAQRTRPTSLARDRLLCVAAPLEPLLPEGGLRRGSTVRVAGGPGSASLALAFCGAASQAGSWVSILGADGLGMAAAAEYGVALERVALVRNADASEWGQVASVLIDAADILVFRVRKHLRRSDSARLVARARDRGAVLIPVGEWGEGAEVRLRTEAAQWEGLMNGGGHLQRRRVDVVVDGRGGATRPARHGLWLPGADGSVQAVEEVPGNIRSLHDAEAV